MLDALTKGAAENEFLRYESAWYIAKNADAGFLSKMLASENANVRLAGLIAIDVAGYEDFPSKPQAMLALGKAVENPGLLDHALVLQLAQLHGDAKIVPALEKLVSREGLPLATTAKAIMLIKSKGGSLSNKLSAGAGKRLIEAVDKGGSHWRPRRINSFFSSFLRQRGRPHFRSSRSTLNYAAPMRSCVKPRTCWLASSGRSHQRSPRNSGLLSITPRGNWKTSSRLFRHWLASRRYRMQLGGKNCSTIPRRRCEPRPFAGGEISRIFPNFVTP